MSQFYVKTEQVRNGAQNLSEIRHELYGIKSEITLIKYNLSIATMPGVFRGLVTIQRELSDENRKMSAMNSSAEAISELYEKTDGSVGGCSSEKNSITVNLTQRGACLENVFGNNNGNYGGIQGSPWENWEEVASIVRKYYPDYTDDEVKALLAKLEKEGCGYVALTNTFFSQYDGTPEEFEEIFGFPMYKDDGSLNHDALITDFYCATDNHTSKLFILGSRRGFGLKIDLGYDFRDDGEDSENDGAYGTTPDSREYRWEMYMQQHGIDVNVETLKNFTIDDYNTESADGYIIVEASNTYLYPIPNHKSFIFPGDGMHCMTVTGTTEDGWFIVSSWGEKWYLDSKDYDEFLEPNLVFQKITYS